MTDISIAMVMR